ncbi:MAG: MAPEG family protein [Halomonadaceae bacterium]|nr:MAG: MAPEG family protein [Halomonadaceae bacterium]
MTGITALLLYVIWTIILALSYAGPRVPQVLAGSKSANHWERGKASDDAPLLQRAKSAHLNSLENLPLFAALVLIAAVTQQNAVVDSLAGIVIAARVGQGIVHMIGTSFILVLLRATLFLTQLAIMLYLAFALMG